VSLLQLIVKLFKKRILVSQRQDLVVGLITVEV
jgi:hypothetical protein